MDGPIIDRWLTLDDLARMKISYAQNGEDILLERAFPGEEGIYIDVGANDPVFHSVTKRFSQRGWRGVNIEPHPALWQRLQADRPRDVNLNVGVAEVEGTLTFYDVPSYHGWSTFVPALADSFRRQGVAIVERPVPVTTLARICEAHVEPGRTIDFLKIDVEGLEAEVIAGADWRRWRPRVVVVEAVWPEDRERWEGRLLAQDYLLAAFDGLNRFYVRSEEPELLTAFEMPLSVLDNAVPHQIARLLDDVGPNALAIARRLHHLARAYPRLASAVRRLLRPAG